MGRPYYKIKSKLQIILHNNNQGFDDSHRMEKWDTDANSR